MKLSDMLLQQDGLSMAHDGATYCGTRGEYTFLILMGAQRACRLRSPRRGRAG